MCEAKTYCFRFGRLLGHRQNWRIVKNVTSENLKVFPHFIISGFLDCPFVIFSQAPCDITGIIYYIPNIGNKEHKKIDVLYQRKSCYGKIVTFGLSKNMCK